MVSLFNLFVNNKNKPKSSSISKVVANHQEQQRRDRQKKAWAANQNINTSSSQVGKKYDPVGTAITENAKKMRQVQKQQSSGGSGSSSGSESGGGTSDYGSNEGSSSNNDSSDSSEKKALQKAQKRALASISKMKDTNVSSKPKINYNDFWNKGTTQKQNNVWELKEEIFLYTFHDKQHHKYLISFNIDCDKQDIMYTCQVSFPYKKELMEYWIPGKTTFAIIGGTFDREVLFIGRVSEINQRGEEIEMVGQNIGWKFKPYMTTKFQKTLQGMTVKNVVKLIFKELGFTKGKYHIDLSGIPDIDEYTIGENCDVEHKGETVQNVPDLKDVVKNLQNYDINKYVAKKSKTQETQQVANNYDETTKITQIDWVQNSTQYYYPSLMRQNYGIKTDYQKGDLVYEPILNKIQGKEDLKDFIVKGYSGDSEYTYEEVLNNICSAIDAHFFVIDTTVCFMSFNALLANSSRVQKSDIPTIDFWQLQDESYILDVNQYGYYNTVKIKYKNGVITKSYDDLVRIFGEMAITYDEPKLDYNGAMLKAQAYLSAHIRDFAMEIKATILHSGKITPANFIKLRNPLTMSEGLFFIQGTSIQWSADNQTLICDLDLRYGPENPDQPEIPEAGVSYTKSKSNSTQKVASGNVSANIKKAAQEITAGLTDNDEKALAIYNWVDKYVKYEFYYNSKYSSEEVLQKKRANCWDTAHLIYKLCSAVDVKCEIWNGTYHFLDSTYGHLWNRIYYKGKMTFADTGRSSRNPIGQHGQGRYIISGSCIAKNY